MTTKDLQRIDELVHSADMAVRVASQLRLWIKRRRLSDKDAIEEGIRFLEEAVRGGRFVDTGEMGAGSSSLCPLNWVADIQFGFEGLFVSNPSTPVKYDKLVEFLEGIRSVIIRVKEDEFPEDEEVYSASKLFDQLGQLLGSKADNALRSQSGGIQLLGDRFSYQ